MTRFLINICRGMQVSPEDREILSEHIFIIDPRGNPMTYINKGDLVSLMDMVSLRMGIKNPSSINGDVLDCRRENIR